MVSNPTEIKMALYCIESKRIISIHNKLTLKWLLDCKLYPAEMSLNRVILKRLGIILYYIHVTLNRVTLKRFWIVSHWNDSESYHIEMTLNYIRMDLKWLQTVSYWNVSDSYSYYYSSDSYHIKMTPNHIMYRIMAKLLVNVSYWNISKSYLDTDLNHIKIKFRILT